MTASALKSNPACRKQAAKKTRRPAAKRKTSKVNPARVERLLREQIDFIPNPLFSAEDVEEQIQREDELLSGQAELHATKELRDLPGHLARLCESKLLTADEEMRLFRRMNYLKHKAHSAREQIDRKKPTKKLVEEAEQALAEAGAIRDRILQSNTRLVMSIVKKFVSPQHSFDDLLSDGIYSLMQAADKFDYDRGFRFSTYAYRAIARNTYRKINDHKREGSRFAVNSEEVIVSAPDESSSSSVYDEAWDRLRGVLAQMMDRLDRRERFIIRSRYALGGHRKVRTFQCLADKLGVSKERVRQLEQRAVAKLKAFAEEQATEEFVSPMFG